MMLMNRKHKYNAKKTVIDGIIFDSKAEAAYYNQLKILKRAGEIKDFEMQVQFTLLESFKHPSKKTKAGKPSKVRAINFTPDFVITELDGSKTVVDVKGMMSKDFPLRAKLFMKKYNMPLILAKRKGQGFEHVEM